MSALLAPGSPEESLSVATALQIAELRPLLATASSEQAGPFTAALKRLSAEPDEHASEPLVDCLLTIAHYFYLAALASDGPRPSNAAPARRSRGAGPVLWTERAFPQNLSTEDHLRAFVQTFFKSGIQMQFVRSLDAGYDWDRPDFAGCMLWDDPTVRQKILHRIFDVERPGAGVALAQTVPAQKFEVAIPESQFRPRFVWQTAASVGGIGRGGTAQAPPAPPAPPAGEVKQAVSLEHLPEMTLPTSASS